MVELGGKSPYGQTFDNSVFIIPALILALVVGAVGMKLYKSIQEKQLKEQSKKSKKEGKKAK